jgi:hypothetical protein
LLLIDLSLLLAHNRRLVFTLFFHPLQFTSLAFKLSLIRVNLSLLIRLLLLLALELVSNQHAGTETQRTADRRAGARMAHGSANNAAHGGAAKGTDPCAFFARSQASSRASDGCDGE